MNKSFITVFFFLFFISRLYSQDTTKFKVPAKIVDGDTVALIDVNAVVIFPSLKFESRRKAIRYDRFIYNVKKVYPYAKLAGFKLNEFKKILDTIPEEKRRKQFMKRAEKELEKQFGDDIRNMTYSQGKILIKLIYRQTGNSSFDIVKELRGSFTAFIFQTLARIFGYDLKAAYDPTGDDQAIERIVQMIESGAI